MKLYFKKHNSGLLLSLTHKDMEVLILIAEGASIQEIRTAGDAKIIAIDPVKERRDLAKKMGTDYVLDPTESSVSEAILDVTKGEGCTMLIEAAGAFLKTFPEMEKCMQVGAKLPIIGMAAEKAEITTIDYQHKAALISTGFGNMGGIFPLVLSLVASKRISPRDVITKRFPLSEIVEAMERSRKRVDGKILMINN